MRLSTKLRLRLFAAAAILISASSAQAYEKLSIVERFTNVSCGPCAQINNAWYNARTEELLQAEAITQVIYHVNWPSPTDPMHLLNQADNVSRRNYYNVSAVPDIYISGQVIDRTLAAFNNELNQDNGTYSPFRIIARHTVNANQTVAVYISITRDPADTQPAVDAVLRVALTEEVVEYATPPGSNGEREFHDVCRKMLPDAAGTPLSDLQPGQSVEFNLLYEPTAQALTTIDFDKIRAVAFLQDDATKEIYQSAVSGKVGLVQSAAMDAIELTGDGDGRLEDGEIGQVRFSFTNYNHPEGLQNVQFSLESALSSIEILTGSATAAAIAADQTVNSTDLDPITFRAHIADGQGVAAMIRLNVTHPQFTQAFEAQAIIGRRVLIMDGDGAGDRENYFAQTLTEMGYFNEVRRADASDHEDIDQYPYVVWFTGDAGNGLSDADIPVIERYLQSGGRLILTGQDIAERRPAEDAFLLNHFGVRFVRSMNPSPLTLQGYPNDSYFGGMQLFLRGISGAGNQTSTDALEVVGSAIPEAVTVNPIFQYPNNGGIAGVRVEDTFFSHSRAIFTSFGIEAVHGVGAYASRRVVMQEMFDFLNEATAVEDPTDEVAARSGLLQNYPNPFKPETQISFALSQSGPVKLQIFDTAGRLIRTLMDGDQSAGHHRAVWNGTDAAGQSVASGVYLYQLQTPKGQDTRRMVLMK